MEIKTEMEPPDCVNEYNSGTLCEKSLYQIIYFCVKLNNLIQQPPNGFLMNENHVAKSTI